MWGRHAVCTNYMHAVDVHKMKRFTSPFTVLRQDDKLNVLLY